MLARHGFWMLYSRVHITLTQKPDTFRRRVSKFDHGQLPCKLYCMIYSTIAFASAYIAFASHSWCRAKLRCLHVHVPCYSHRYILHFLVQIVVLKAQPNLGQIFIPIYGVIIWLADMIAPNDRAQILERVPG